MYLKSLSIQGFKSFPDKIKLEFDKGITAVVGPNGSGKSNIGDAVKWVLGEQSSKSLRGTKMEDVIFSGTEFRKPMGYAEVTLEIDNSDKVLNVEENYCAVTRKLYRSGESEYIINGKSCRLKDVTELFLDTGLGRDGYSIIGQGKIAEIVSAKSTDRRDIFESAAGISKFRYKKAEAEKRLQSTEENLLRLKDIVSELESRIAPLKRDSEKAKKFIELSEEKKSLEITLWVRELSEIKKKLNEIEDKILINTADYENTEREIERNDEKMNVLTRDMQDSQIRIEELRQRIREKEKSDSKINSDIAVCENEIRHFGENISSYKNSIAESENSDSESENIIKEKINKRNEYEKELSDTQKEYENIQSKLSEIISEEEKHGKEFEENGYKLNKLYITKSTFVTSVETGKNSLSDLTERLDNFDAHKVALTDSVSALEKELDEVISADKLCDEKISEEENRLNGIDSLYKSKSEKLSLSDNNINNTTLKIKEINQKLSFLNGLENSMEGMSSAVKQVLIAGKDGRLRGIHGSLSQLISTENKYSAAIEVAAGAALQNIIVNDEECAKDAINFLKEKKAGRATFLPITSVKGKSLNENLSGTYGFVSVAYELVKYDEKYREIILSVLGRTAVFEDMDTAISAAKRFSYRFKIVTLDGQIINAGGSFTGGSLTRSVGVLSRKSEIDKLNEEKITYEKNLSEEKSKQTKLKAEVQKLYYDSESSKNSIQILKSDKIRFESEKKRINLSIVQTKNQIENFEKDKADITAKKEKYSAEIKSTEKRLSEIEEEIQALEKKAKENGEAKDNISKERNTLSEKLSAFKISEMSLKKDIENMNSEIKRMEEERQQTGDDRVKLYSLIDEAEKAKKQKQEEIVSLKNTLSSSGDVLDGLNNSISDEKKLSREKETETTELRRKSRELSDAKEKFAEERTRLEERKKSIQDSSDSIIKSMESEYELYLSEAQKLVIHIESVPQAQRNLNQIKGQIKALGSVNVGAIDEYAEVSERYEFLSSQLEDVITSKTKIEDIIAELTETMKKQFTESFNAINENFGKIFIELFGGGKAGLTLTEPENVLESGIEINVAPPGKVIKNLSLLSGGEQAFVAIALYFAILNIKPAPFCILDEIEAALDDVNVTRYAKYLRHYTKTTQFITITHRRGTMDEADVLYGVTMQQKGISRLIKLEQPSDAEI